MHTKNHTTHKAHIKKIKHPHQQTKKPQNGKEKVNFFPVYSTSKQEQVVNQEPYCQTSM